MAQNRDVLTNQNSQLETRNAALETHLLFAGVAIIAWWIFRQDFLLLIGLAFAAIGLFVKPLARQLDWAWRKFSQALGWVMSRVIMGIIYIFFLVPIAFLSNLSRKDPLKLKRADSYWHKRDTKFEKKDLEKMW